MQDNPAPTTGRTRLGNPANGNLPRPQGACRVLMIGDLIGKPGRVAVENLLPELRERGGNRDSIAISHDVEPWALARVDDP